jgi:hypothetical protein
MKNILNVYLVISHIHKPMQKIGGFLAYTFLAPIDKGEGVADTGLVEFNENGSGRPRYATGRKKGLQSRFVRPISPGCSN